MTKIEFIESYIKPDDGGDYQWNDNHEPFETFVRLLTKDFDAPENKSEGKMS